MIAMVGVLLHTNHQWRSGGEEIFQLMAAILGVAGVSPNHWCGVMMVAIVGVVEATPNQRIDSIDASKIVSERFAAHNGDVLASMILLLFRGLLRELFL